MRIIVKANGKNVNIPISSRLVCLLLGCIPFNTIMRIANSKIPKDVPVTLPELSKKHLIKAFWCLHKYKGINLVEVESKNGEKVVIRL